MNDNKFANMIHHNTDASRGTAWSSSWRQNV